MGSSADKRQIQKYEVSEVLFEDATELLCKGHAEGRSVCLKAYKATVGGISTEEALSTEGLFLREAGVEGVPTFVEILHEGGVPFLVFERPQGNILDNVLKGDLGLAERFEITIALAEFVERLHQKRWLLLDINLKKIVWDRAAKKIGILDCSAILRKAKDGIVAKLVPRGVAYCSPEQTGRFNRPIDERSDVYVVGMAAFHIFSNRPPVDPSDIMKCIHFQMAFALPRLNFTNVALSNFLDSLLAKMTEKAKDKRYQSISGALFDLKKLFTNIDAETPPNFVLGSQDFANELIISQELYGRAFEIDTLKSRLSVVDSGAFEMVFLHGQPGIGKSSLIKEFLSQIDIDRYVIASGKYRLLEQNEFLKGVILACEQIIRRKSIGDEVEFLRWSKKISVEIGDNWELLSQLLPGLSSIEKRKALDMDISATERRARLLQALYAFLKSSASAENPLILFFDDIQWCDQGSRDIISKLATEEDTRYILLICSYRTDEALTGEVDLLMRGLRKESVPFTELTLSSIDNLHITALIQNTLDPVAGDLDELVRVIQSKAGGNPFFVKQILYHIFEEGILKRNRDHQWTWDADAIVGLKAASNVLELLEGRIAQLQPDYHKLLLRVSCFDGRFSRAQLTSWFDYTEGFVGSALAILESENYIYSDKENNYFIFHDRIREAAYGLLSREEKRAVHDTIGNKLFQQYQTLKSSDLLIKSISHLNKAFDTSWTFEARLKLAEQNRDAASLSRAASAFGIAKNYANAGLDALSPKELDGRADLQFDLKTILAECLYLAGDLSLAEKLFSEMEGLNVDVDKKAGMYVIYLEYFLVAGKYKELIATGFRALEMMGIKSPKKVTKLSILWNFILVERQLKKIGIANLPKHRPATEKRIKLAIRTFLLVGTAGYFVDRLLFPYMVIRVFYFLLKYGGDARAASDGALYSAIRLHKFGMYQSSYELAKSCQALQINYGGVSDSDEGSLAFGGMMLPFLRPIAEAKGMLEKSITQCRRLGGLVASNYCALYLSHIMFHTGEDLDLVAAESEKHGREIRKSGHTKMSDCLFPMLIAVARLRETNPDEAIKDVGDSPSALENIDRILTYDFVNPRAWYGTDMLIVETVLRNRAGVEELLPYAESALEATPMAFNVVIVHLMLSLYRFDELRDGRGDKKAFRKKIKASEKKIARWLESNPITFKPFWFLLRAEKLVSDADLGNAEAAFFDAIEGAVAAENLMLEALSKERFGRFLLTHKKTSTGYKFLADALGCYEKWRATAKVNQLKQEFPALGVDLKVSSDSAARPASSSDDLDVFAVVKSCQIIGNEMDLSKLLQQIVFLLIENAGAEKGHVFIKTGEELILKATSLGVTQEDVRIVNTKLESVDTVSKSLIKYVAKSLEAVIIDDAQKNELVSHDAYVKNAGCKSLVAMPITNKGQLIGVIWLENNSATGVFSDKKRIEILEILASQAAISFENARLFGQEQEKMRMEGELRVAQTVQNTLFEESDGAIADFKISGSIEPASECGGDWWHYGSFGDVNYFCIGDATGHGVSAALVTSAVRSAMATMAYVEDLSAAKMIDVLNNSVAQSSKGRINMTMFLAVYDKRTGELTYCNNSHEPTLHIGAEWLDGLRELAKTDRVSAIKKFRKELIFLSDVTGPALGAHAKIDFQSASYKVSPKDYLFCYTDGIPEMYDSKDNMLGERHFLQLLAEALIDETEMGRIRNSIRTKLKLYRGEAPLRDDVTFILVKQDQVTI